MLVVTRYVVPEQDAADFRDRARTALLTMRSQRGCRAVVLGRSVDDPTAWTLSMRWTSVGDYRRALSVYDVKVDVVPLLQHAVDEPTAFEELLAWDEEQGLVEAEPALAADAGSVSLGEAGTPRAPR
jgi:Antibiotic biosynthesis monooxygenase